MGTRDLVALIAGTLTAEREGPFATDTFITRAVSTAIKILNETEDQLDSTSQGNEIPF